jgi:hypothetical protein
MLPNSLGLPLLLHLGGYLNDLLRLRLFLWIFLLLLLLRLRLLRLTLLRFFRYGRLSGRLFRLNHETGLGWAMLDDLNAIRRG